MKNFAKEPSSGRKTTYRKGLAGSLLAFLVVAAVLVVNLVMEFLPVQYTQIDLSASRLYDLSDATEELMKAVDQDVTIYYMCETGAENDIVVNMLDRYAGLNSRIRWEQRDPAVYPTFAGQYGAEEASPGSSVVVCGDSSKLIDADDYYNYEFDYTVGMFKATSLDMEDQLTSAIQFVTSRSKDFPKVYQLTGHGETELYGTFVSALRVQNMEVETISLLSAGQIPEDADAVVIHGPAADFTEGDIRALEAYMEQGGSLLVTANARVSLPNLESFLAGYGMSTMEGLVVEGDAARHMKDYPHYILPNVVKADATANVPEGMTLSIPFARGMKLDGTLEGVKVKELLTTSDAAYNKAEGVNASTTAKEAGDGDGPFAIAAQAEKTVGNTTARLVWVNSADMLTLDADTLVNGANGTFILSCINWLTDAQVQVLAGAKSLESEHLVFTAGQVLGMSLIFVVAVPLVLVVTGAVVVLRRRRR